MKFQKLAICLAAAMAPWLVQAGNLATQTSALSPGTIVGADFLGSFGGDLAGAFPVALDDASARLGGVDGKILALPGQTSTPSDSSLSDPSAEDGYGSTFGTEKGFGPDPAPVTAVPEPETYPLMLGGLAMICWLARRRGIV